MPVRRYTLSILALSLGGCIAVGPNYERPDANVPDEWRQAITVELSSAAPDYRVWWQSFADPVLDKLVARAAANRNLLIAAARIEEARAQLGIASGQRWPDLDGEGAATRQRSSESQVPLLPAPQSRTQTASRLGVGASWEFDLWGRVRRSVEAAGANYDAAIEDFRDVQVLLYAEVGSVYVNLRTLQERLRLARANVDRQRDTLRLVEARNRAELARDFELRQAELNLATTEAALPSLEASINRAINALAILLGEPPQGLYADLAVPAPIPAPPGQLSVGIPADVVRSRPDVRRAERQVAAQTARVGIATVALLPNFFVNGSFAYAATSGQVLESGNRTWSVGPIFSWNLFDGGRVRNAIRVEDARTEQAVLAYEQTILNALRDVEDSMIGYVQERRREEILQRSVAAAQESVRLVRVLYKSGLTDFQNVLDSERSLFGQEDLLAASQGELTQNVISIYRSLGGGWDSTAEPTKQ